MRTTVQFFILSFKDQTISNKPFHIFVSLPSGDSKQRQHLDHNFCSASTQLCLFFDQENFKKKR